jgi:hypothetical protein
VEQRSYWRVSLISDIFWGTVNFVALFFRTLFSNDIPKNERLVARPRYGNSTGGSGGGGGGGMRQRPNIVGLPKASESCGPAGG